VDIIARINRAYHDSQKQKGPSPQLGFSPSLSPAMFVSEFLNPL